MYYENLDLDYSEDHKNDKILRDIKNMSLGYLNESLNIEDIDEDYLIGAYGFIDKKYVEISDLKSKMLINFYNNPFKEVAVSMDKITLTNQLEYNKQEHILVLTKDVSYLLDDLAIQHSILRKIISEKIQKIDENLNSV